MPQFCLVSVCSTSAEHHESYKSLFVLLTVVKIRLFLKSAVELIASQKSRSSGVSLVFKGADNSQILFLRGLRIKKITSVENQESYMYIYVCIYIVGTD